MRPGSVSWLLRAPPPSVSAASRTSTSTPSAARVRAAASPLGPLPTTTAFVTRSRGAIRLGGSVAHPLVARHAPLHPHRYRPVGQPRLLRNGVRDRPGAALHDPDCSVHHPVLLATVADGL